MNPCVKYMKIKQYEFQVIHKIHKINFMVYFKLIFYFNSKTMVLQNKYPFL